MVDGGVGVIGLICGNCCLICMVYVFGGYYGCWVIVDDYLVMYWNELVCVCFEWWVDFIMWVWNESYLLLNCCLFG